MTIDKAIKCLNNLKRPYGEGGNNFHAVQLGIEALEFVQKGRQYLAVPSKLLPSETEGEE